MKMNSLKPTRLKAPVMPVQVPPRFAGIVSAAMDAIISLDERQRIILFNPAAEKMFDRTARSVLGLPLDILLPRRVHVMHHKHIRTFAKTGHTMRGSGHLGELTAVRRDGTEFPIEASISHARVNGKSVFTAIVRDLTERRQAEKSLAERADYLRILNSIHRSILAAPSSEAVAEIVLNYLVELLPFARAGVLLPDSREGELFTLASNLSGAELSALRFSVPLGESENSSAPTGSSLSGEVQEFPDISKCGLPEDLVKVLRVANVESMIDIPLVVREQNTGVLRLYFVQVHTMTASEMEVAFQLADILALALQQARLHEVVNTTRERLHALARRQLELEEIQRRKMSRDLHDMVGQNLTALNINLHFIARRLPPDAPVTLSTRLEDSSLLVEEIVERIRGLMADLRPSILDDLGLTSALRWYSSEFSKRTEIPSQVTLEEIQPRLPQEAETALFRIAQEALTNVAKHAQARHVSVRLAAQRDAVLMTIEDDGRGFNFATMRRDPTKRGVGLVDMRERAEAIGGTVWVECEVGKGTRVQVQVAR